MTAVPQPPAEQRGDVARRYRRCAETYGIESGYDPACCRWPKSCSPYPYQEAIDAGNVTEDDLEPPPAPRPESGGQQQAAAEVLDRMMSHFPRADWRDEAERDLSAALAEAARPGQELRERVAALATKYTRLGEDEELHQSAADAFHDAALELRAALEDPR